MNVEARQSTASSVLTNEIKPLLRGWSHAFAAIAAVIVTAVLLFQTRHSLPLFGSLLIFGLSMIVLYSVSAIYHIGSWQGRRRSVLRALDHANIFLLIAGTYTPICVNVLSGWLRTSVLALIWTLALAGILGTVLTFRLPRWISTSLYIGLGWVSLITLPELFQQLPWQAVALLMAGGVLYTLGACVYAMRRPNPLPRVFGFHEIFHLFVIAGSASFVVMIWLWVVPFQRI